MDKKSLFWTRLSALAMVGIFLIILFLAITVNREIKQLSGTFDEIDKVAVSLGVVSEQLQSIDWISLEQNINDTALTAQKSMNEAARTIEAIDIASLNQAISDLQAAVEPFVKITEPFR